MNKFPHLKKYLGFICLFLYFRSYSQENTQIQLFIQSGAKLDSTQLLNLDQIVNLKSFQPEAITFSFRTKCPDLYRILVNTGNKQYQTMLWLDPGRAKAYLKIKNNQLTVDSVFGSSTYNLAKRTNADLLAIRNPEEKSNFLLSIIQRNKENPFALIMANNYLLLNRNDKNKLLLLRSILTETNTSIKSHLLYEDIWSQLIILLETKQIALAQYPFYDRQNNRTFITPAKRGFILLDFWFTACLPCVEQHEAMKKQQQYLRNKNVQLISISIDKDFAKWDAYLKEREINWLNYRTIQTDNEKNITEALRLTTFPTYFILNSKKEVVISFNSFAEVKTFLDQQK